MSDDLVRGRGEIVSTQGSRTGTSGTVVSMWGQGEDYGADGVTNGGNG